MLTNDPQAAVYGLHRCVRVIKGDTVFIPVDGGYNPKCTQMIMKHIDNIYP